MANKIIKNTIKHYYDEESASIYEQPDSEPDKTKSISELSRKELYKMRSRLNEERELQRIIRDLKQNSGERDTYEKPFKVDTTTPINQLYHHGILGQKWGVRRYQNKDGTRTPAGKKREEAPHPKSDDHMNSRVAKSKSPSGLSNDELRKLNERLQLEETYKRLSADKMQKSESWVKKSLSSAGEQALTEFSKGLFLGSAKLLIKEFSPQFAEAAFNIKDKKKD
jgi:hypothetical protein